MIVGVDPGGTVGLAWVQTTSPVWDISYGQVKHPLQVLDWIKQKWVHARTLGLDFIVLVEDFNSGGAISRDGAATLKMCGLVYWWCVHERIPVQWVQPQMRMLGLPKAKNLLPKHEQRHACDALAHVIAFEKRRARSA